MEAIQLADLFAEWDLAGRTVSQIQLDPDDWADLVEASAVDPVGAFYDASGTFISGRIYGVKVFVGPANRGRVGLWSGGVLKFMTVKSVTAATTGRPDTAWARLDRDLV